jgi:rare lipoprotein A
MRIRWNFGFAYRLMRFCELVPLVIRATRLKGLRVRLPVSLTSVCCLAALAGCAQPPAGRPGSKEYFPSSVYGAASPRVVADGESVPRGGGRYLVGRPYTIAGRMYYPREVNVATAQTGKASWYGSAFHGRRTANGEVYDMRSVTAAHPTWPLPSYARVTNTKNGRSMIVRVNDRGPYHAGRVMDVSSRVADSLDFKRFGTAEVKIEYVGKAGLAGSDDQLLMASLRSDGRPATLEGNPATSPIMVAEAEPAAAQTTVVAAAPTRSIFQAPAVSPMQVAEASVPEEATSFAPTTTMLPLMPPLPPIRPVSLGGLHSRPSSNALNYAASQQSRAFSGPFEALKLDRSEPRGLPVSR